MRWALLAHQQNAEMHALDGLGGRARGEDRADFEKPQVAIAVGEVVLGAARQCLRDVVPEARLVLGQRVLYANVRGVAATYERHRSCLVVPHAHHGPAYAIGKRPQRIVRRRRRAVRPDLDRKAVVPVEPRHFLNQVDFSRHIGTPAGHTHLELGRIRRTNVEPGGVEEASRLRQRDIGAEHLLQARRAQGKIECRRQVADYVDSVAADPAAGQRDDDTGDAIQRGDRGVAGVHSALESVAGVRGESKRTPGCPGCLGVEACDLDQQVRRGFAHFAVAAAHDAGNGLRPLVVCNHHRARGRRTLLSIERDDLLLGLGEPNRDSALELERIECVNRLAELVQHVIRRVHHVVDGAGTDRGQAIHQPRRTRGDLYSANCEREISTRPRVVANANVDAGGSSLPLGGDGLDAGRRHTGQLRQLPLLATDRRQFTSEAHVRQQVRAIGADVNNEAHVAHGHRGEERRARLGLDVQLENPFVVVAEAEFLGRTEHAIGNESADLAALDLDAAGHCGPDRGERVQFASGDIRRATHDLQRFRSAHVHRREPQVIRIGVWGGLQHPANNDRREIGAHRHQFLDRGRMRGDQVSQLPCIGVHRNECLQPLERCIHPDTCSRKRTSESYSIRISGMP